MKKLLLSLCVPFVLFSCGGNGTDENGSDNDSTKAFVESMGFETLSANETGIDFYNTITESGDYNFFTYEYIYNGGGVAVGDINNDGLTDVYFTGNQVADKLYLNKGNMIFEDITATAFEENANEGWHTGVSMVDINADGWLDIYVCRSGDPSDKTLLQNMLFVNNQDNTFTERSAEYGVNVQARTTHAAFFDYDNDGDLDLYVLNHPVKTAHDKLVTVEEFKKMKKYGEGADVFLENRDGKYVDITKQSGIVNNCFGLGIAIGDLDENGFMDVYVSNDYQDPDFMYMNNGDGTFTEEIRQRTKHISNYSMGNDIADFNNDGYVDVMSVDMAAEDHVRSKRNMGGMSTKNFWDLVFVGFHYQYMFNGLQMNNGNGTFSEVGQIAGVSKTDWSWAPLFADFDNDGKKDLFITNGYKREARDNDYSIQLAKVEQQEGGIDDYEEMLSLMPTTKIYNYVFKNKGDLEFEKKTEEWNFNVPVNSNGAAFADFDNDGDLDLVVNNMEEQSFIMKNTLQSQNQYIRFKLKGPAGNIESIGAKIKITVGDEIQYHEVQLSRGYASSVESVTHFGLGSNKKIDKVEVVWPDGKLLTKTNLTGNQLYELAYSEATKGKMSKEETTPFFEDVSDQYFSHRHDERRMNDFESEVLMPNKMSQLGPFIAKGDANGDGLEDIYVSGAANRKGSLYLQQQDETFKLKKGPWEQQEKREEMDAEFFDADGDGDLDLYVVSGGNEYVYNSELNYDQLYINNGDGNFTNESVARLPKLETSGQRIAIGDYDGDGDPDIYVGGRQTPGYYPFAPRSFLLQNNGKGQFEDVTNGSIGSAQIKEDPSLMGPGMITDVIFDDFDQDEDLDLIMVGEWMPVTFFENVEGKFSNVTKKQNPEGEVGWWYSIAKGDFNGDGKNDYVAGNLGENNKFHPTKEKPLEIYCHDFDGSGTYDIVLAKYQENVCYPVRGRQCTSEQMPFIQDKFPTYSDFATADVSSIYGEDALGKALHYSATSFASSILLSEGGTYKTQHLPRYAQIGPINESLVLDINKDGNLDLVSVGNNHAAEVETIRYDAGRGVVLLGDGKGQFTVLTPKESGFFENNDCKDMAFVNVGSKQMLVTVSNQAMAKSFMLND